MRGLTKFLILVLATGYCLLPTAAAAQSRTNQIYRRCGLQIFSPVPRTPAQVSIDVSGNILLTPCYQGTVEIDDLHSPDASGQPYIVFSSQSGLILRTQLYSYTGFQTYGDFFIGGPGPALQTPNFRIDRTVTAGGTTGNQIINKLAGTFNLAAGTGTGGITITNSLVTANSIIFITKRTNDTTCVENNVVASAGSFIFRTTGNCAAETSFGFLVTN